MSPTRRLAEIWLSVNVCFNWRLGYIRSDIDWLPELYIAPLAKFPDPASGSASASCQRAAATGVLHLLALNLSK